MAQNTKIVQGVELLEFSIPDSAGQPTSWVRFENVAPGTVSYTSNTDTVNDIIPEDKDSAVIRLYTPGEPDAFNFGLLELSELNFATLFNVEQDLTTGTTTVLAKRKHANLCIRLTTRPIGGVKKRFTYFNTQCDASVVNNFTKDDLVQISVVASIMSYKSNTGQDAIYRIETLTESGAPINLTPPTVAISSLATATNTYAYTGTASYAGGKTAQLIQWTQVSGPNQAVFSAPNALTGNATGLVAGTYVFKMTVTDSAGASASVEKSVDATGTA